MSFLYYDLSREPRSRSSDPITSHLAAEGAAKFAGSHAQRILAALDEITSGTPAEIGEEAGLTVVQVDRRLCELQRANQADFLKDMAGKPVTRDGFRIWVRVAA